MGFIIFLAVLALLVFYGVSLYNGLVTLRQEVSRAWSDIDALLVQRHDELLKVIETCARHMQHEGETLERLKKAQAAVFQAAGRGDVAASGAAESLLRSNLCQLLAAAESHPQLRADESFGQLRVRVEQIHKDIANRREPYNGAVNLINVRMCRFPNSIVSRMLGFRNAVPLEFTGERKRDAGVRTLFG